VAKSKIAEPIDAQLAIAASPPSHQLARAHGEHDAASQHRALRSLVLSIRDSEPIQTRRPPRAPAAIPFADDRRRLERDLHDGVQNELVALIVTLALAQEDPKTPPPLVETLAGLEARAQAVLDSVRDIARGIYPSLLADFGLAEALRAQAARAAVDVHLIGSAPRGTEAAEEAVYFACSEAIQNAAKYAGRGTRVAIRLHYERGSLAVRVADDGRGFDPAHTPRGAGLQNIRDRIEGLGGTFNLASRPGYGTAVVISLPWPAAADRQ
jgi:signal transduction histidine kinase